METNLGNNTLMVSRFCSSVLVVSVLAWVFQRACCQCSGEGDTLSAFQILVRDQGTGGAIDRSTHNWNRTGTVQVLMEVGGTPSW